MLLSWADPDCLDKDLMLLFAIYRHFTPVEGSETSGKASNRAERFQRRGDLDRPRRKGDTECW